MDNTPGGETKVVNGYLRSALVNRPDHVEISLTPEDERTRYVNEDVDSLLLAGTDKYVKRLVKVPGVFDGLAKVEWVRVEYRGRGIDLYSLFTIESEKAGSFSKIDTKMTFIAVAGLRWYFCRKVGLWAEGGRNVGYVSAGLSYRF